MDLGFGGQTILIAVGDKRIRSAIGDVCLQEGANVVFANIDKSTAASPTRGQLNSQDGRVLHLRVALATENSSNEAFDEIERWASPPAGVVLDWGEFNLKTMRRDEPAILKFTQILGRLPLGASLLFVDAETSLDDGLSTRGNSQLELLEERLSKWGELACGSIRVNLLCVQSALQGPGSRSATRSSRPQKPKQTNEEAVGSLGAFLLSSKSSFFNSKAVRLGITGMNLG